VLIHPLADHRRILPLERLGKVLEANPDFLLVISYNPGYQSALKDLKQSTRQRFLAVDFGYPQPEQEARIVAHESGVDAETAGNLALLASKVRNLVGHGLEEGASTRLLIYAGRLIVEGIDPRRACEISVVSPVTDDPAMHAAIRETVHSIFPA
jgi:nitric oxide reductase NorQ protein